jgi:UDP-N-acetylmuramoyl-tripeptide--D-alanyl-D-alanine ligase
MRTAASERSYNNEIGVPLTLANAAEDTQAAVIEMGARGPGQLALLCAVARPTIGVVTAVAPAHTEAFHTIEGVAAAKAELVEALSPQGVAVLNADDSRVAAMSTRTAAAVVRYSAAGSAGSELVASSVTLDEHLRPRFTAATPWGVVDVELEARGVHQVGNALAALAVAGSCGVDLEAAADSLAGATLSPWRMEVRETASGATVVNDAYNANPASMAAALQALAALPARRRSAVLGEMAELGDRSVAEHLAVADLARRLGISVVAIGTSAYGVTPVGSVDAAVAALGVLGPGDAVLVKASRVAQLERLAALLV